MRIFTMKKSENKESEKNSSEEEDWKRLEKWRFGRANYP